MSGLSDYAAESNLSFCTGQIGKTAPTAIYLALFTTAPTSDAGTGGTEVTGGSYARVQVAGQLACTSTTASTTITLSSTAPAWLLALGTNGSGCTVWSTTGQFVGTVSGSGISGTTVNLTANAAVTGLTTIAFSAFGQPSASSGNPEPNTSPASITNGASITFAQATASWGTVTSFGLYDASSSGNLYTWDYLGNFKWIPFSCTSASPAVFTTDASADVPANSSSVVVTQKYGGTLPTLSAGSFSGILTSLNASTNTFQLETLTPTVLNSSSVGGGSFRQVLQQPIAINVTASFAASTLTITSA